MDAFQHEWKFYRLCLLTTQNNSVSQRSFEKSIRQFSLHSCSHSKAIFDRVDYGYEFWNMAIRSYKSEEQEAAREKE